VHSTLAAIRDGALDRAIAEPGNARYHLAFAGAVDAVAGDAGTLPLPVLVSMAAVPAARRALERDDVVEPLLGGAALVVACRNVTVAEAAAMAQLPADEVRAAAENGRVRSAD
jgi:hypothetical protein